MLIVEQVLICEGNTPQIQSNHIKIHRKNLFFLLKASSGLKCKFTKPLNPPNNLEGLCEAWVLGDKTLLYNLGLEGPFRNLGFWVESLTPCA